MSGTSGSGYALGSGQSPDLTPPTLNQLRISAFEFNLPITPGAALATITGQLSTSAITLNDPLGFFAVSANGAQLLAGVMIGLAPADIGEADSKTYYPVLIETPAGFPNAVKTTAVAVELNQLYAPPVSGGPYTQPATPVDAPVSASPPAPTPTPSNAVTYQGSLVTYQGVAVTH